MNEADPSIAHHVSWSLCFSRCAVHHGDAISNNMQPACSEHCSRGRSKPQEILILYHAINLACIALSVALMTPSEFPLNACPSTRCKTQTIAHQLTKMDFKCTFLLRLGGTSDNFKTHTCSPQKFYWSERVCSSLGVTEMAMNCLALLLACANCAERNALAAWKPIQGLQVNAHNRGTDSKHFKDD
jgi:hypothetical protein